MHYRDANSQGNATSQFIFGDPGDRVFAADWNGTGSECPGLLRPADTAVFLRYENSQGIADENFAAGDSDWHAVARNLGTTLETAGRVLAQHISDQRGEDRATVLTSKGAA